MNQRILANLGFLLQTAGLLTLLPIGVGFIFNENAQLIPLFLTCIAFLGGGFLLNALCARKDLDVKSASLLLLSAFLILPLIGAIPYIYTDPFNSPNPFDRFTNSYFESVSGFTTTGFSFIENTATLPRCILVFRSLTELMGGVGVVFLVLAFFQSKRAMPRLGGMLGIDNLVKNFKKMFLIVFAIYALIILVFTGIFLLSGYSDSVATATFVIDTVSGGFAPSAQQFPQYLSFVPQSLMIIMMFLGSVNFAFNYHLFTGKIKRMLSLEIAVFLAIMVAASIALVFVGHVGFAESLFHVVSLSSTAGGTYLDLSSLNSTAVLLLVTVMVIGGCAFSMAGGIKISRFLTVGQAVGHQMKTAFHKNSKKLNKEQTSEVFPAFATILSFILVLLVFAALFSTVGISFTDALFEVGAALSTTGATLGTVTIAMPLVYKWLIIAAMTIGKVEVLTVAAVIVPFTLRELKRKTIA
jgi:trk system potassium uptake protein TrkH